MSVCFFHPDNAMYPSRTSREIAIFLLNLLQANIMLRLSKKNIDRKQKEILMDAMIVTISGISSAMKNTG